MARLKIKNIKIENAALAAVSLIFLIFAIKLGLSLNDPTSFLEKGVTNLKTSGRWWSGSLYMLLPIIAYGFLWLYAFLLKTIKTKKMILPIRRSNLSKTIRGAWFVCAPFAYISVPFSLALLAAGTLQEATKNKIWNNQLINASESLTITPFFWLHNNFQNVLGFLTPAIIESFLALNVIMTGLLILLYLSRNKKPYKGFVISTFLVLLFSMPIWYFFPVHSPTNAFLYETTGNFNASLTRQIENYRPNEAVKKFQDKMWDSQKNAKPITTLPSMHWAWSAIVFYYLFRKHRATAILSSLWLFLALLGTVYLGNHYLIDGLIAAPLAVAAILLAEFMVRLETRYREENAAEAVFTQEIQAWLLKPFNIIKNHYLENSKKA